MRSPGDRAVRRFIRQSTTARIATLSPAGNPDLIPLWFVTYRGHICMSTRSENPTARDLIRNHEVVLLFHGEQSRGPARALRVRGRAVFRTGRGIGIPVAALSAVRYLLPPGGIWNTIINHRTFGVNLRYKDERAGEGGIIEIVPLTAEFLKLPS